MLSAYDAVFCQMFFT